MPDINFNLTATDNASAVIDRTRAKLDGFNRTYTAGGARGGGTSASGVSTGAGTVGGINNMLGKGAIGGLAGLTIIGQAVVGVLQKMYGVLTEASPYLKAITGQFQTAMNIYLRPMGDALAKMLAPSSEYAIEQAESRAEFFEDMGNQFGPLGTIIATVTAGFGDLWMGLFRFQYGVADVLSQIVLWPLEQIGKMIGVDLPNSLSGLLESLFGIKGGFDGVLAAISDPATYTGFASNILNSITGAIGGVGSALGGLGDWLWKAITGGLATIGSALTGFGTWVYHALVGTLGNIGSSMFGFGYEVYKGFHNILAGIINAVGNYEFPIVGKMLKGVMPNIPYLDVGGSVLGTGAAVVHQGETVLTAKVTKALAAGSTGGMSVTNNFNAPIYGVDDLERTMNEIMSRQQMGYSTYR